LRACLPPRNGGSRFRMLSGLAPASRTGGGSGCGRSCWSGPWRLCGAAHARLGEVELARQRLTAARVKREPLTHPGLPETRAELARLGR
jgi:hypothetical protein